MASITIEGDVTHRDSTDLRAFSSLLVRLVEKWCLRARRALRKTAASSRETPSSIIRQDCAIQVLGVLERIRCLA
jgi:hypothetical protein